MTFQQWYDCQWMVHLASRNCTPHNCFNPSNPSIIFFGLINATPKYTCTMMWVASVLTWIESLLPCTCVKHQYIDFYLFSDSIVHCTLLSLFYTHPIHVAKQSHTVHGCVHTAHCGARTTGCTWSHTSVFVTSHSHGSCSFHN